VGVGPDVRRDVARLRLRSVRDRCVLSQDRGLARFQLAQKRPRTRRLEQALCERDEAREDRLVHHSDRGTQYLSIRYTERLAEAGVQSSVGSRGDSYDNALAESVIGLFKTEVIRRRGPWRGHEDVEFATLEWVWWFNHHRLLEPIGYVPPEEFEEAFYRDQAAQTALVALT
jgi:putative transposase